ncbi:hypothetical protein [Mycobacterium sp. MMS18-G62]
MNTIHNIKTKGLIAAFGVAAAAAVAPALMLAGAATAHADTCSSFDASCSPFPTISDEQLGGVTAAPGSMGGYTPQAETPLWPQPQPVPGASAWNNLPQSNPITAIFDGLGIERGW